MVLSRYADRPHATAAVRRHEEQHGAHRIEQQRQGAPQQKQQAEEEVKREQLEYAS